MDNCTHHFKNTLTSFNILKRLDKPLYLLEGKKQNIHNLFTFEYVYTIIFLYVYILRMNTLILHQEYGTSYSVMNVRVAAQV